MRRLVSCLVALLLVPVLAASVAHAEPTPAPSGHRRSPGLALGLSLGVTGAGVLALLASEEADPDIDEIIGFSGLAAIVVGPSLGHWYSGRIVTVPMGVRLFAGTIGGAALASAFSCRFGDGGADCEGAEVVALLGLGAYTAAAIYEIVDAPSAARAYNRRHGLDLQVAPAPIAGARGVAPGLAVLGRF